MVLLGAVIIMTLMASLESGTKPEKKNYTTEHKHLALHDGFLVSFFIAISILCNVNKFCKNLGDV